MIPLTSFNFIYQPQFLIRKFLILKMDAISSVQVARFKERMTAFC